MIFTANLIRDIKSSIDNKIMQQCVRVILPVYFIASLVFLVAISLWLIKGIPLGHLTRDPASSVNFPLYFGVISSLGVLMWAASASLCLFVGLLQYQVEKNYEEARFFLSAGLLTLILLFDDLFLLHERFFPNYLNISELIVYFAYIAFGLSFLIIYIQRIISTEYPLLFGAGILLAMSMLTDRITFFGYDTSLSYLVEDGFKFMGITTWFVYFARSCWFSVKGAYRGIPVK